MSTNIKFSASICIILRFMQKAILPLSTRAKSGYLPSTSITNTFQTVRSRRVTLKSLLWTKLRIWSLSLSNPRLSSQVRVLGKRNLRAWRTSCWLKIWRMTWWRTTSRQRFWMASTFWARTTYSGMRTGRLLHYSTWRLSTCISQSQCTLTQTAGWLPHDLLVPTYSQFPK